MLDRRCLNLLSQVELQAMFLSLKGGVNIRQDGDCCSMWLILSERHMEKKKRGKCRSESICHSSLYLYCYGWMIGGGGCGGQRLPRYNSGVFSEFHYLRVSMNTFLCNPNSIHSESLLPCSRGCRQSVEPH